MKKNSLISNASWEREVNADRSILLAITELMKYGRLFLESDASKSETQYRAALEIQERMIRSHGKGVGLFGIASALYELLEHAVFEGGLPIVDIFTCDPSQYEDVVPKGIDDFVLKQVLLSGSSRRCLEYKRLFPHARVRFPVEIVGGAVAINEIKAQNKLLNENRYLYYLSTNGLGAGATEVEAVLHAILELIERDALSMFLIDVARKTPSGVKVVLSCDSYINYFLKNKDYMGGVDIRLIPSVVGNVAIALSQVTDFRGRRQFGVGASLNKEYAIERAVLELEQEVISTGEECVEGGRESVSLNGVYGEIFTCNSIPGSTGIEVIEGGSSCDMHEISLIEKLETLVEALNQKGFYVYSSLIWRGGGQALSGSEMPIVVHVYIPGFERLQIIRDGFSVEPAGRLRTEEILTLFRGCRNERYASKNRR